MKKPLMIAGLVLAVGALSPQAASAATYSQSSAEVHWQDFPAEGDALDSLTLTSAASVVGTQTYDSNPATSTLGSAASARTGPGTMGVAASVSLAGQQSRALAETGDGWVTGSPVGSDVPMGLRIHFSGTLDPWMVDASRPLELADMMVTVRYVIDAVGGETQFTYWQGYIPQYAGGGTYVAAPYFEASFARPGSDALEDATQYLVFSGSAGNVVSFDHTFGWTVPAGSFSDFFQAEARIDTQGGVQSPHAINFLSTFGADPISIDPNVVFYSEGGRTTVPEPSAAALVALAGALIVCTRRRRSL